MIHWTSDIGCSVSSQLSPLHRQHPMASRPSQWHPSTVVTATKSQTLQSLVWWVSLRCSRRTPGRWQSSKQLVVVVGSRDSHGGQGMSTPTAESLSSQHFLVNTNEFVGVSWTVWFRNSTQVGPFLFQNSYTMNTQPACLFYDDIVSGLERLQYRHWTQSILWG